MEQLLIQKYLLEHSLDELAKEHGVYARWSIKNPRKFTLNYDQLEARESDPLSQECRGLVLMCEAGKEGNNDVPLGNLIILAFPMKRFFNYGQGAAAPVDFSDPKIKFYNKLDGTCCILYHDPVLNDWCVGTRSVPDADLVIDGLYGGTFSDLFWQAAKETTGLTKDQFCDRIVSGFTYVFELCTPVNQVVVFYKDYSISLLAVRSLTTLKECSPENYNQYIGVPCVETYKLETIEQMIDFVANLNPSENEGLVVCDSSFNRLKVKNPGYLALNKLKDSVVKSPRALVEIILLEKEDDVIPLVPEHIKEKLMVFKEKLRGFINILDKHYEEWYDADRKTFAIRVQQNNGHMGYNMSRWANKVSSAHDWIKKSKQQDGSWSNTFLDMLIDHISK